ncbi:hypothetical protein QN277_018707 [Acacia crassicarpa]|uniref:non-specific serine/threonine protein kinase n=1 Tax=Acacia crassicarpa TaxID=499986 RepID=A0AAE1JR66_9FABA|nr:hypothetical protein QN277_018707 [Acacia crassicarpa]
MSESEYFTKLLALMCINLSIFFFIVASFTFSAAASDHGEAKALLNWKARLINESQATLSSWNNVTNLCRNWKGISCGKFMSVSNINLSNLGLQGTLDNLDFASFPNLQYFDLSYNQFHGNIPHEIGNLSSVLMLNLSENPSISGPIPKEIGKLSALSVLDLSACDLTETIPSEIGNLKNLTTLVLAVNSLSGPIPEEIGMLSNLLQLDLSGNSVLSSGIPSPIGNLNKLQEFYLNDCNLFGPLPNEIGKLNFLTHIDLGQNELDGPIPPSIGNLTLLETLVLSNNSLSGPIPESIGNAISLQEIYIEYNNLSGPIPATIGNLTNLDTLVLMGNNLSGQLPQEMNTISWHNLQLGDNHFHGRLPQQICQSGRLFRFVVKSNQFSGPIPTSLKNCSNLERLVLQDNQLVDNITTAFGVYPNLDYIDLSGNQLYGHLSSKWGECQNLTQLIINHNKLSGDIPPELGEMTKLSLLNLSSNHLSGKIPKELGKLIKLMKLSLSHNNFSGSVPSNIGSLSQLEILELAANNFNGSVTRELGELKSLRVLNLSKNKFDESIPLEFGELRELEQLDLSDNLLIGTIPSMLAILPKLQLLNLSHNNLTGSISSSFGGPMSALSNVDISYNQLEGPIPIKPVFHNFDSLRNNKGLCGNVTGLSPCGDSKTNKHGHKSKKFLIIFLPLTILLLAVVGAFCIFLLRARNTKTKDEEAEADDIYYVWSSNEKISYENIIKATEEFDDKYLIGRGGQGSVYKAKLPTGVIVAVKKLHSIPNEEIYSRKAFTSEIRALTEIKHRNIVKLKGFCSHSRFSFLIYEYLEGGSLDNILKDDNQATKLDWHKRMNVVKGVANALFHMHHGCSLPIVHRDISSKNVLLTSEYEEARIIDFGTSKFLNPDSNNMTTFAGTFGYAAPEIAYIMEANEKCDVYSFGVLTLEIIMGMHPGELVSSLIEKSTTFNLLLKDVLDPRLSLSKKLILDEVVTIAKIAFSCLDEDPRSRPTMEQVSIELERRPKSHVEDPFDTITIGQLMEN